MGVGSSELRGGQTTRAVLSRHFEQPALHFMHGLQLFFCHGMAWPVVVKNMFFPQLKNKSETNTASAKVLFLVATFEAGSQRESNIKMLNIPIFFKSTLSLSVDKNCMVGGIFLIALAENLPPHPHAQIRSHLGPKTNVVKD